MRRTLGDRTNSSRSFSSILQQTISIHVPEILLPGDPRRKGHCGQKIWASCPVTRLERVQILRMAPTPLPPISLNRNIRKHHVDTTIYCHWTPDDPGHEPRRHAIDPPVRTQNLLIGDFSTLGPCTSQVSRQFATSVFHRDRRAAPTLRYISFTSSFEEQIPSRSHAQAPSLARDEEK